MGSDDTRRSNGTSGGGGFTGFSHVGSGRARNPYSSGSGQSNKTIQKVIMVVFGMIFLMIVMTNNKNEH